MPVVLLHVLIGTVLGTLSGLGIGGGSLLMLYLTLAEGMDPAHVRSLNLLFFLPGAAVSTWLRRRQTLAPKPVTACAMAASLTGAVLGSLLLRRIPGAAVLKPALGVLFVLTGIRELRYRAR